jgi:hypothetical protein
VQGRPGRACISKLCQSPVLKIVEIQKVRVDLGMMISVCAGFKEGLIVN